MLLFFIFTAVGSLILFTWLVGRQWWLWRRGEIQPEAGPSLSEQFWLLVDFFALNFPLWLKRLTQISSFYSLVGLRHGLSFFKRLIIWAENRFSRLIDLLRHRWSREQKGSVSFFLEEIKLDRAEGWRRGRAVGKTGTRL